MQDDFQGTLKTRREMLSLSILMATLVSVERLFI
jgi:hypothetical protein